jgi:hypothetical protein
MSQAYSKYSTALRKAPASSRFFPSSNWLVASSSWVRMANCSCVEGRPVFF